MHNKNINHLNEEVISTDCSLEIEPRSIDWSMEAEPTNSNHFTKADYVFSFENCRDNQVIICFLIYV